MVNPFYVNHLTKLMDNGHEDNIVPQLYEWAVNPANEQNPLTFDDFAACIELMLNRAEKSAMQEEASYSNHSDLYVTTDEFPDKPVGSYDRVVAFELKSNA